MNKKKTPESSSPQGKDDIYSLIERDLKKRRNTVAHGTKPTTDFYFGRFLQSRTTRLDDQFEKLQKRMDGMSAEIDKQKSKNLEILAIFGALFTFITIQVQQLDTSNRETGIFVGILALGGLLLFSGVLVLASSYRNWWKVIMSLLAIVTAILILTNGWSSFKTYLKSQDTCTYLKREVTVEMLNSKDQSAREQQVSQLYNNLCK